MIEDPSGGGVGEDPVPDGRPGGDGAGHVRRDRAVSDHAGPVVQPQEGRGRDGDDDGRVLAQDGGLVGQGYLDAVRVGLLGAGGGVFEDGFRAGAGSDEGVEGQLLDHPLLIERELLQRRQIGRGVRCALVAGSGRVGRRGSGGAGTAGVGRAFAAARSGIGAVGVGRVGAVTAGLGRAHTGGVGRAHVVLAGVLVFFRRLFLDARDVEVLGLVLDQGAGEGLAFVEVGVDEGCGAFRAEDALPAGEVLDPGAAALAGACGEHGLLGEGGDELGDPAHELVQGDAGVEGGDEDVHGPQGCKGQPGEAADEALPPVEPQTALEDGAQEQGCADVGGQSMADVLPGQSGAGIEAGRDRCFIRGGEDELRVIAERFRVCPCRARERCGIAGTYGSAL